MNINLSLTPAEALDLKLHVKNKIGPDHVPLTTATRTAIWHLLPRLEWLKNNQLFVHPPPDAYEPGVMIPGVHQPDTGKEVSVWLNPGDTIVVTPDVHQPDAPTSKAWWCEVHKRWATRLETKGIHVGSPCCDPTLPGITMPCVVVLRETPGMASIELARENGWPHL